MNKKEIKNFLVGFIVGGGYVSLFFFAVWLVEEV